VYPLPPPLATWQLLLHLGHMWQDYARREGFHFVVRLGRCCSPRRRMPCNSRSEGLKCVDGGQGESLVPPYTRGSVSRSLSLSLSLSEVRWMMWRATSAMPYLLEQMLRSSHRTLHPEEAAGAYTRPLLSST